MERDGGRKCEIVLPLAKQDLICSSGEHSSSPEYHQGESKQDQCREALTGWHCAFPAVKCLIRMGDFA